ncbi:MAG: hypothetical protein ACJ763_13940 [Bdellovibrionia bacterium]
MKSRCPKMSAQILSLVLMPLALPLALPKTASAVSRIKRAPAKEIYAATDASEMQPGVAAGFAAPVESDSSDSAETTLPTAPATLPAASAAPAAKAHKAAKAKAAMPAASAPKAAASAAAPAAAYDAVPSNQSDAILQRLKIVENLVRKYGRAYDYRTHTLKELELIQSTLEGTAAQAQVQAPAEAQVSARMQQRAAVAAPAQTAPAARAASAPQAAPQAASSDTIRTGQAAAVEENAEDTNLGALPPPAEYDPNNADQEN